MCGIVGYTGTNQAKEILLSGLKRLEYRGYDSAGIALQNKDGLCSVTKSVGRISTLEQKLCGTNNETCGIGHTRWATHGKPTETNAHPHASNDNSVFIVHNGIVENHAELRSKLCKNGYFFNSETDSEVLANLIDYYKKKYTKPLDALARVCLRVVGSYAVCILFSDEPGTIYCLRKDSPLVVGKTEDGVIVASDVSAMVGRAKFAAYADNNEMIRVTQDGFEFFSIDQEPIKKELHRVVQKENEYGKNGYPHYMLKEIYEQKYISEIEYQNYVKSGNIQLLGLSKLCILRCKQIHVIACGSAYHAALVGKSAIESIARVPVCCHLASEYRYNMPIMKKTDLAVFVSQSGETADTLQALRETKRKGIKTIAIVNVSGSSLSREADVVLPTHAGTETAVATTKAYFAQILVFHFLALKMAEIRHSMKNRQLKSCISDISKLSSKIEKCLNMSSQMQHAAEKYFFHSSVFFLGRGTDYCVSQEANLKLKEISYVHSEAYAAGELKHGTISLMDGSSLVIGLATDPRLACKTLSNLIEVKSRGATVVVFTSLGRRMFKKVATDVFCIPACSKLLQPLVSVVPLQLFAYYTALARGCDIDKPRNLAKSVTVE